MKRPDPETIELDVAQFEEFKRHVEQRAFEEEYYAKLGRVLDAYRYLVDTSHSFQRIRHLHAWKRLCKHTCD